MLRRQGDISGGRRNQSQAMTTSTSPDAVLDPEPIEGLSSDLRTLLHSLVGATGKPPESIVRLSALVALSALANWQGDPVAKRLFLDSLDPVISTPTASTTACSCPTSAVRPCMPMHGPISAYDRSG